MVNDVRFERLYDGFITWLDEDFSHKSKDERIDIYESYRWMFSGDCDRLPTLEPLISDSRASSFRERFKEWFLVVCDYSLSPFHLGDTSYYHFLNHRYWKGTKKKGNKVYPQRVILALGLMGVFTAVDTGYLFLNDRAKDHGRKYRVDMEKLGEWTASATGRPNAYGESSVSSLGEESWVTTTSDDNDFDFSFLESTDDESWYCYDDWCSARQKETISTLEVIPEWYEKAKGFLENNPYDILKNLSKENQKKYRVRYRNCKWLVSLHDGKYGRCKVDDKGGRFYSILVGMKKDYRRNGLLLDGERIVEVDVSASQPTLIGLKVKKETGKTTEWLLQCLSSGDFYKWVKKLTGTTVKRDKVKKYVMIFLYSCYGSNLPRDYQGEHLPPDYQECKKGYKRFEQRLISYLKENEPEIYALIDAHKRNPVWSDKVWEDRFEKKHRGRWVSSLPVEMQKVEVDYVKTCLSRLPDDILFFTIHDAICVSESNGERVKEIMEKCSLELYGEKIAVKIENASPSIFSY